MKPIKIDYDERPEPLITAYRYDEKTAIFAGQVEVRGERFGNGDRIYRLPANHTMEPAPIVADGEVAVYIERAGEWVVLPDHRGETWFDWAGKPQLIGRPGDPREWGLRRELQRE